ncbi:MAG: 6-phosphogluconolactonase [Candidatus Aureabacteria bacterium]|nr:6-phosphogluconolactonase [Candidatus Auribacterota bacterium]
MPGHDRAKNVIEIYADRESMSRAAAELFARRAGEAVRTRGRFIAVLSGGETPRRMYALLAAQPLEGSINWKNVHVFWGDERCVPADNPMSNERMARESLLDHVPIPPDQVHPIRCEKSPHRAAVRCEKFIRSFFERGDPRLDLVLLGLGENGHTASLFPGSAVLEERERWVAEVTVPGQDVARVTMTAPLINLARMVVFLVSGSLKSRILHDVLEGPRDTARYPAQLIQPEHGELLWMADREAAGELHSSTIT